MVNSHPSSIVRLQFALLGQCAFTYWVLKALTTMRTNPRAVLLAAGTTDPDPFESLRPTNCSRWLTEHRFYHVGWRFALQQLCEQAGITVRTSADPCGEIPDVDVVVVAGLAQRVPESVLERFGHAAINVHTSLLPCFRGPQPEAQFIMSGERETGATIHAMTASFDAGPVLTKHSYTPPNTATVGELEQIGAAHGAELLSGLLKSRISAWSPRVSRQQGSYFRAYDREQFLNMQLCSSIVMGRRLLRLRPEGYAFWEDEGRRIYPLRLDADSTSSDPSIWIGNERLITTHWVERTAGIAVERGTESGPPGHCDSK